MSHNYGKEGEGGGRGAGGDGRGERGKEGEGEGGGEKGVDWPCLEERVQTVGTKSLRKY